jgi:hypothetical protein
VLPLATTGVGDGDALEEAAGDGDGLAAALGDGVGVWVGLGDVLGAAEELALGGADWLAVDGAADGEPAGATEPEGPGLADGGTVGTGVGDGAGALRPMGLVLISKKSLPVDTTDAGSPLATKTAATWSEVTPAFLKLISHFVPPV